jgi:hypothetical protein
MGFNFRKVFAGRGAEFAADDVGGEAGAEKAAVDGGHFLFVDFAAVGAEFAFDALAHHGGFIGGFGSFLQCSLNVPVRDAA